MVGGEAGRDRAAERVARPATGGDGQVRSISSPSQASTRSASSGAAVDLRGAVAGQVGRDHAVRRHQVRDHPHPVGRVRARAVQQHHRRAVAALEHGGRHAGQLQPPLGDGDAGEQPARAASLVDCVVRSCVAMAATLRTRRRAPRIARNHQLRAARGVGQF